MKINGDYSTDPSRKNIDRDETSQVSFCEAITIITDTIVAILNGEIIKKGFFTPFIDIPTRVPSYFRFWLFESITECLEQIKIKTVQGNQVSFSSLRLKPNWLNYEDYEKLCCGDIACISKEILLLYPDLCNFTDLRTPYIKMLSLEEILERFNSTNISVIGCAQIVLNVIKQYWSDLDFEKVEDLRNLKIFPVGDSFVTAEQVKTSNNLRPEIFNYLCNHADLADIGEVFQMLGIELDHCADNTGDNGLISDQRQPQQRQDEILQKGFEVKPAIEKWRSAEKNAAAYLRSLKDVLSVADVSQSNLGYDLEVMLVNGKKVYVEVKSVSSFSESFKITNNEYSSANHYGEDYYIALVINEEPFQMKLIHNPIDILEFQKKCEKWSWYCGEYKNTLQEVTKLFSVKEWKI